jgi:hypothetical protein
MLLQFVIIYIVVDSMLVVRKDIHSSSGKEKKARQAPRGLARHFTFEEEGI